MIDPPPKRTKNIGSKKLLPEDELSACQKGLCKIASSVLYNGVPYHKKTPGDFGLHPPCDPRPDKSFCDDVGILKKDIALRLLREGLKRGTVSKRFDGNYPKNIWAVTDDGCIVEAVYDNAGGYHGYPFVASKEKGISVFCDSIRSRWEEKC